MANVKISDLTAAGSAALTQEFEVNDSGNSRKVTGTQLDDLLLGTSSGLIARTGTNTRAARTITASSGITVSNGNGVSGNPTVAGDFADQTASEAGTSTTKVVSPQGVAWYSALYAEPLGKLKGINTQTSSYTAVLADAGKVVELNNASANNFTVPPNSSVAFPVNTRIDLIQYGAGQTTIVAGSGVTVRSSGSKLKLTGQYSGASLYKRGTDEWVVIGDLAT